MLPKLNEAFQVQLAEGVLAQRNEWASQTTDLVKAEAATTFDNKPLAEVIRGTLTAGRSGTTLIVYGAFLVSAILFMPRGITGLIHDGYLRLRRRLFPGNE